MLQGNVLIIMHDPNDDAPYVGVITFNFVHIMALVPAVGFLSVEGNETSIAVMHDSRMGIVAVTIRAVGLVANSLQTVSINLENVSQLKVNLSRMEVVSFISFCFHPN